MQDIYEFMDLLEAVKQEAEKLQDGIQKHYPISVKSTVDVLYDGSFWYLQICYGDLENRRRYKTDFVDIDSLRKHIAQLMIAVNICNGEEI